MGRRGERCDRWDFEVAWEGMCVGEGVGGVGGQFAFEGVRERDCCVAEFGEEAEGAYELESGGPGGAGDVLHWRW